MTHYQTTENEMFLSLLIFLNLLILMISTMLLGVIYRSLLIQ
jgi:hypothetical protein